MRDPEIVARIEKAIEEKYGIEASRDIRHSWDEEKEKLFTKQYDDFALKQREATVNREEINKDGYLLVKKTRKKDIAKNTCPLCENLLQKAQDDVYVLKYDCCFNCYVYFIEGREERWRSGWRPDKDLVLRRKRNGRLK